ncbi:hypothetical protein DL96DRAFT_1620662 [Flagelloscypha sp. PMI_526]|nr:hypothetical protein DL96DRAFT_1620662 [Flagelloscypha sp. PMI_526]
MSAAPRTNSNPNHSHTLTPTPHQQHHQIHAMSQPPTYGEITHLSKIPAIAEGPKAKHFQRLMPAPTLKAGTTRQRDVESNESETSPVRTLILGSRFCLLLTASSCTCFFSSVALGRLIFSNYNSHNDQIGEYVISILASGMFIFLLLVGCVLVRDTYRKSILVQISVLIGCWPTVGLFCVIASAGMLKGHFPGLDWRIVWYHYIVGFLVLFVSLLFIYITLFRLLRPNNS